MMNAATNGMMGGIAQAPWQNNQKKKCSNCGKELEENAKFCPECGKQL